MGRKKSFTSSGLAALTGESPMEPLKQPEKVQAMEPIARPIEKELNTTATVVAPKEDSSPTPVEPNTPKKRTKAKKNKNPVLQDPNRRSIKKSNAAVTLYLNATNLNRLKQHAEAEEQKISWLIDEMIYEYLSDKL